MMAVLWVVLFWASVSLRAVTGLPIGEIPQVYPHESHSEEYVGWGSEGGLYTLPALALVLTAVGLLFGCTWCYQHKDCKIFTESVTHLHDARSRSQPPDSGFSEPANNNISEDNNNGPISLREMQNIANNNAAVYIVSENEERNRVRESVVEFEPLPRIRVLDPLERCADWFAGDDFPRNRLQYLREIGRGWFGRVVEGEIEDGPSSGTVAVKILNQNASLEDKARFLDEGRMYRDIRHENILPFIAKCLSEDPWLLMFELCSMDLHQYLEVNRPKMAILNESGVPLQLMCDVTSGLAHLHSRGFLYGTLWSGTVLIRNGETARALLGQYGTNEPQHDFFAPEVSRQPDSHTTSSEVWSVGFLLWEVCAWGATPPRSPPPPHLPCPYRNHLYQVMQLCWNPNPENRPTASQVHALLNHLHTTHLHNETDDHFEERWQRLKPNSIPKIDEHIAIVHAPSTSTDSQFGSDLEFESAQTIPDSLSVGDTAVSRSSSIMSDKEPLSVQIKSESLNNLHGSFEDVRNIYLTHNEAAALECHQGNISMEEKEQDRSDSSVDPWLKDIITGSQDDVSYFKDVSDVIKNLDNILNSEKTSSSESSHQASPSRDNLSLECKKDYPMQTSLVKSPGIRNFQNISEMGFDSKDDSTCDDDVDRDTIGTLSHSFERHSDTNSQYTLENITPETPIKDFISNVNESFSNVNESFSEQNFSIVNENTTLPREEELPNDKIEDSDKEVPKLKELCQALPRLSNKMEMIKDCTSEDNNALGTDIIKDTKSVELIPNEGIDKRETICDTGIDQTHDTTESQVPFSESEINHINKDPLVNEISTTLCDIEQSDASAMEDNNDLNQVHSESLVQSLAASQIINEVKGITTNDKDEIGTNDNALEPSNQNSVVGDHQVEQSCITHTELFLANEIEAQNGHYCESGKRVFSNDMRDAEKQISYENEDLTQPELIQMTPVTDVHLDEIVNELKYNEDNSIDLETGCASLENVINLGISHATLDNETSKDLNAKESHIESDLDIETELGNVGILAELPDLVQISERATDVISNTQESQTESQYSPEKVQNISKENISSDSQDDTICLDQITVKYMDLVGSKQNKESASNMSTDSTVYMNFSGEPNEISKMFKNEPLSLLENQTVFEADIDKNDSTVYLDLPSVIREMDAFLHAEKLISGGHVVFKDNFHASTPVGSNSSADNVLDSNEHVTQGDPNKVTDYSAMALEKLEQKGVADTSPFESPTKSHPTDTYDENSSVVLGPFESYTQETFKSKIGTDLVDLPKEELLAFSSNFSEINLETPSPLRDGNFLNEVPDLIHDDFDDSTSQPKPVVLSDPHTDTDETEEQSTTEKRISPSTPPNSPGNFLASTSQAYIVDIDLDNEPVQHIDINEMDVSQLAIAENENNMNLEYSGPLVEESLNDSITRFNDTLPESFLAGNGGVEETENVEIDEERMKELRNELELKLPLAQVAGIEPASSWTELPPPPELLVTYGALSPIAEETGHQLTAYENDDNWNISVRTESSESYPEPANNSTDEVTELPTGLASATHQSQNSTYTIHSNATYTLQRDGSKEVTMSADSLNGSPLKKVPEETASPDADKTYTICDAEKESNCERISQVSPFLLSPTTDTSAPSDLHAAVSTLSKATVPTDAKSSKPSETQCLSKATSIDSWCSNDTLYNVEENFDDLAMDPDLPLDFAEPDKSESEDTLTHNEDDKELSHCSTYIVHDSRSELCETFSPDSITANDNNTYTKVKTTPSANTKSDLNDSTKNTQTKDLAYGTLGSGMPSFSNCTTELASAFDDTWKLPQPELVRRSPMGDVMNVTPVTKAEDKIYAFDSPEVVTIPKLNKMDSVEITFEDHNKDINYPVLNDYSNINFKDVINTMTSTPVTEADDNMGEVVACTLTKVKDGDAEMSAITSSFLNEVSPITVKEEDVNRMSDSVLNTNRISDDKSGISDSVSNFETFMRSAEVRPQEISNNTNVVEYLETSKITCNNSEFPETSEVSSKNFDIFVQSAEIRPQNSNTSESNGISHKEEILNCYTNDDSSKNTDSFMMSVEMRPQDLSNAYKIANKETKNIVNAVDDDNSLKSFQSFLDSAETKPQERSYSKSEDQQVTSSNSIPFKVSETKTDDSETSLSLINFQSFIQSAEIRPQDISKTSTERVSSNGENSDRDNHLSQNSNDSLAVSKKTISYSDFENSAASKPQDMQSLDKSRSDESGVGSEGFRNFEAFARNRPQDLLSLIDASSMLLSSERTTSEHAINSFMNRDITPSTSKLGQEQSVIINPTFASFRDSPDRDNHDGFVTDLDLDENEQPHSIIITESPLLAKINKGQTIDGFGEELSGSKADEDIDVNMSSNILEKSFIKDSEEEVREDTKCNGSNQVFATVNFINETFEELLESNVDDNEANEPKGTKNETNHVSESKSPTKDVSEQTKIQSDSEEKVAVTQDFLQNEKNFCQLDAYFPLLSDIRFTGPGTEIMSTSFTQESPTEPTSPECERDSTTDKDKPSELLKEWDSDTDSHSTNSSSGEFIWKDGDGHETALVPNTHFQHQRDNGQPSRAEVESAHEASSVGSGDSGSGSEGDEVEFVPSSWDCRAEPAKSSLRSLEQPADGKKRVVFKRQKYHCVYEYPREASDLDVDSPAHYLPDLSTYCEWDPRSAEEAEVGYGQLYGGPSPFDMYPLRAGIAFGADYDEDFYITSTARPFELGVLSTTSQFFPGMHLKQSLLPENDFPPPSPLPPLDPPLTIPRTTLELTTPDSGVDITPTIDEDLNEWKPDSTSSSESVSPSSPGGELGGLRHTRDKLKLDLPPSPHLPSPKHNRVFNFVLEKPKRPEPTTPLVMTDETPIMMSLPLIKRDDPMPEPTFSTFGKSTCKSTADPKNIVLTDNENVETVPESTDNPDIKIEEKPDKVEPVKGEGTVLDSGDEDSGIESSSKATLERKPTSNIS